MEEDFILPEIYFSKQAAQAYEKNKRMQKIQREMAERALELLCVSRGTILDVGCGTGFSMEVARNQGLGVVGIDISESMLEIARKKGFKVELSDFRKMPFKPSSFSGVISISALQWVHGTSYQDIVDYYDDTAREISRVLKKNGRAVIQFYPKTEQEFQLVVRSFKKARFKIVIAEDYPDTKKRKRYLILQK